MENGTAIVIVTFNSEQTIGTCLNSVLRTLRPCDEVLVVDNNSHDNTAKLVRQFLERDCDQIKFLPQTENLGFSKGCNVGINHSDKEYIILLNPDTEVFGNWVERLTTHFRIYENTGAVGALSNRTLSTQNIITYVADYANYVEDVDTLVSKLEQTCKGKSLPTKLLIGFCLALRRDLIEKHGGLDEALFLGNDDLEMSWRLRESGYFLRIALDVFVNHERQISFASLPENKAKEFVQDAADVLFRKMVDFYRPQKPPNPRIYFNIDWWHPRILDSKPSEEVFEMNPLPCERKEILPLVNQLLKEGKTDEAIDLLKQFLHFSPNDYSGWLTLGLIYLTTKDYQNAEFALKNASAYEVNHLGRATEKLQELYAFTQESVVT